MRWRLLWWMSRSLPSAMNGRRGCRPASNSRSSAPSMTTEIRDADMPRASASWRSGSWTVIVSSATAALARVATDTMGKSSWRPRLRSGRGKLRHVLVQVEQERDAGQSHREGGRRGSPEGGDLHQAVARLPPMLGRQPDGREGSEGQVLREMPGEAGERRRTGNRMTRTPYHSSVSAWPGSRRPKTSTP